MDGGVLYTGAVNNQGTLEPGANVQVNTGIWVGEPGLITLGGWEVERETGERSEGADSWVPRVAWTGIGGAQSVEVVQA